MCLRKFQETKKNMNSYLNVYILYSQWYIVNTMSPTSKTHSHLQDIHRGFHHILNNCYRCIQSHMSVHNISIYSQYTQRWSYTMNIYLDMTSNKYRWYENIHCLHMRLGCIPVHMYQRNIQLFIPMNNFHQYLIRLFYS